jgi:hypothetical protein
MRMDCRMGEYVTDFSVGDIKDGVYLNEPGAGTYLV